MSLGPGYQLKHQTNAIPRFRSAVITTAIGNYERKTKVMMTQTFPVEYYCFTDCHLLSNPGNWTIDFTPYHLLGLSRLDNGNFPNSLVRNQNPYMVYKFYKTQFYRFPCLQRYDMIVWTDMTWQFMDSHVIEDLWKIFRVNPSKQIISLSHHSWRKCTIKLEMEVSIGDHRWRKTSLFGQSQPFQDVKRQYEYYVQNGYTETYWKSENLSYRGNRCIGLWQTNFIAYLMGDLVIPCFLDRWYIEMLNWSTQCQISFPYIAQQLAIYPYTLPSQDFPFTGYLRRHAHGK
jgi:hypothetical protein